MSKVGRNDPCPCGSGKKYKKCCGQKTMMQKRSFANLTPENVKSSMNKIFGMVSKTLAPGAINEVQKKLGSLSDRLSNKPPEVVEEKVTPNEVKEEKAESAPEEKGVEEGKS